MREPVYVAVVNLTGNKSKLFTDAGVGLSDEHWLELVMIEADKLAEAARRFRLVMLRSGMRSIHPLCHDLDTVDWRWTSQADAQRRALAFERSKERPSE